MEHDRNPLPEDAPATAAPAELLVWAARRFRPRVALSCSFGGPGGLVLAHMLARLAPDVPLLFIDTGCLFPETYRLRHEFAARYGLRVLDIRPQLTLQEQEARYGRALWERDPDACCRLRKVEPMMSALTGLAAWITALRRDQSAQRATVLPVERHQTANGRIIYKINPLAYWTRRQIWDYLIENRVPYNPLLDEGYKSLGCIHCTRRVADAADERAGRWFGREKSECGLHTFTKPLR